MAKKFDSALRGLFGNHSGDWLQFLGVPKGTPIQPIDSDISSVTAQADKVFKVLAEQPFIAHFEFQSTYKPELTARLLRYNAILHEIYRLPVATILFLPRPEADGPAYSGILKYQVAGFQSGLEFRFSVLRVWRLSSETLLNGGPGTAVLAPLSDDAKTNLAAVLAKVWQKFSKEKNAARLFRTTSILMGLRYTDQRIERVTRGVKNMTTMEEVLEQSSIVQAVIRRKVERAKETAHRAGVRAGVRKGMEQGLQQGVEQGLQEGLKRALETGRETLLKMGTKLFGEPNQAQRKSVLSISNIDTLRKLELKVLDSKSWKELLSSVK
jgi:hypothetical protein